MKKMVTGLMMMTMTMTMTALLATFPLVSSEHRQNKHNHNRSKRNCNSWNDTDTYIPSTYKKADNVIFGLPSIRRVVYISRGGGGGGVSSQPVKNKTQNTNKIKSVNDSKNKIIQKRNASIEDDPGLLILIRVLYFTYYASLGSLLPYLPVYYHSLGHGGQIIGMLGAIKPFTTFLVGPGWGIISDQFGCPFKVLYFTFLISLVGQLFVAWRHDHFWIMSMVFITAFFNAPVKSLLDSLVMSNIKNSKLYGRLRLYGQLGFGVGSSAVGLILSKSQQAQQHRQALGGSTLPSTTAIIGGSGSTIEKLDQIWQTITGYKLLFFTHALLSVPTFFCMRSFDRWTKKENVLSPKNINQRQQRVVKQSRKGLSGQNKPTVLDGIRILSKNNDALLFFFLVLVVGISSGVIENFAYVRIREVGGSGKEMGLSRLVSSMAGAPMFWFSGPLTELVGADRILALSLVNYVVRFFNYAFMRRPLQGLPAEALRGATFAAFWSTCTIYASRIAPPGMQATMLMMLNAMYGGLGQSLGAIIGGKMQSKFGTVRTFVYAGIFDAFFVTALIAYLSVRKDSSFKNPRQLITS